MIIIKIIILYFIQIRHNDDFPSTGRPTRLVMIKGVYLSYTLRYSALDRNRGQSDSGEFITPLQNYEHISLSILLQCSTVGRRG